MNNRTHPLFLSVFALVVIVSFLGLYLYFNQTPTRTLSLTNQPQTAWVSARLSPSEVRIQPGQEFSLDLWIDSSKVSANVFSLELIFPVQKLEFVGFDKSGSLASIWFEEEIDPAGLLRVTAGVPNPGFLNQGKLVSLKFKALKAGQAEVSITSKSAVFRNQDNKNILGLTQNAQIEITP